MAEPVLVTGFEPFGVHTTNISGDVALSLSGKSVRDHTIEAMVLPVDEKGSKIVSDLVKNRKFAAIIHIGLAENTEWPRIEVIAKDELDLLSSYENRHGLAATCRIIFNLNEFSFID